MSYDDSRSVLPTASAQIHTVMGGGGTQIGGDGDNITMEDFKDVDFDRLGLPSEIIERFKQQIISGCLKKSGDTSITDASCSEVPKVLRAIFMLNVLGDTPIQPIIINDDKSLAKGVPPGTIVYGAEIQQSDTTKDMPFGEAMVDAEKVRIHGKSMIEILRKFQKYVKNKQTPESKPDSTPESKTNTSGVISALGSITAALGATVKTTETPIASANELASALGATVQTPETPIASANELASALGATVQTPETLIASTKELTTTLDNTATALGPASALEGVATARGPASALGATVQTPDPLIASANELAYALEGATTV